MPEDITAQEATNSDQESQTNDQESSVTLEELRKLRRENQGLRKRLHEAETAEQQRKEAEMTEVEKLKKQLSDYQQKETQWASEKRTLAVRQAVQNEAARLGIIDSDAAFRLLDVEVLGDDLSGVGTALQELLKAKPYLKGAPPMVNLTNPANQSRQTRMFTRTQLRDTKFFAEHQTEIMQAMKDGRILNE